MTDNFLADTTLSTNVWFKFMGSAPVSTFVMPTNAAYWVKWSLPASGYQLQDTTSLLGPWSVLSSDMTIPGAGQNYQLITTNDIPVGTPAVFFELAKP